MKKALLFLFILFSLFSASGQTNETFENLSAGQTSFTAGGKTFNLFSTLGFVVYANTPQLGYNKSNKFIHALDAPINQPQTYGQTGTMTVTSGTFKLNSLWVYLAGDNTQNPNVTLNGAAGSVTFRGKLAGSTQFTVVKTTNGANLGFGLPGNGFMKIDFATEGGSNNTNFNIDQLEIQLSSNYDYFAIDDFNFSAGGPPPLTATTSQTDVTCNGSATGSASVTPSGGTAPYTYLWNTGAISASISGLTSGNYSCTIKDVNNTSITKSFTINQPALLVASQGTISNVTCNGGFTGSATVVVTGGTTPYTYDWNGTPTGDGTATISGLATGTYTVTVKDAKLCQTTQSFTIGQPAAFTVTTSQTDILCNGAATGSASVNVSGGTGAYSYSWSPSGGTQASATGLTAGNYVVTIRDANLCQTTRNFTINQPSAPLTATAGAITNVNCYGAMTGSATVNVTGGTGAYTYSWSPSGGSQATASGLAEGTYTVTVKDANLCQTTQSFTITQPAAILSATTASIGVSCFSGSNGSAGVTVSGGTPGYTYAWTPLGGTTASISSRPAGNYTCTITDSKGCTLVKNITIGSPAAFSATVSKTDVNCNGGTNGSATVTASGATAPYSYAWSPVGGNQATASGLRAGNYVVTVTDANTCVYTVNVTIDQPAALTVTPSQTDVLCNGTATGTATVNVSGGTPGYTYLWSPSGGSGATATNLSIGNYSCLITDAKGCSTSQNFTITQPAVLTATTSQINATCTSSGEASVNPTGGTTPYTYLWSNGQNTQTATNLAPGNYNCLITDGNGCTITKNLIITSTNTLVATASKTDVLCHGSNTGSATVVPSGAPGPYTYVWLPSGGNAATASNLTAGNYSVTITSANGCSIVKNFTINEPPAFVVTPSQTDVACNGSPTGVAKVIVTGGTGAYTYSWSPSGGTASTATGLTAGTYTVTIKDANLCQTTQSFTITEPPAITASTTQTNVTAAFGSNGSASVTATGGTGAYTYLWAPTGGTAATATGLSSGNYTVKVTDANNCSIVKNVTILEPASISGFTAINKTYGDADFNIIAPTTNSTGSFTYASSDPTVASVTGNTITIIKTGTVTITATQAANGNYTQTVATTTLNVSAKQLTITNTSRNKVYGQVLTGADFAGTITGLENGDNISVTRTSTGSAATAAVNTYPIVATLVDPGNKLGNYTVSNPNGTLTVTAKALSIASTDRNKVYGQALTGADFAGTITGLENGDNISVTRTSTGAVATAVVNTYPIIATLVDPGNKLGNYTVSNPTGTLTVTAKALSIASTDRNKVYGQVLTGADFAGTITGLENGDNISVTRTSTGAAATAAVNTYPIVATLVDPGNKLGNYTVSNPTGTLTVTAKALSIASTDRNKVYGQVLTGADFAGTITGLENGDNISVTRTSTGAAATAAVNTYPIVATLVDPGNKLGNYTVSTPTGTLTITAKALSIASTDRNKVYGQALTGADFAGTITGLENGDNISVTRTSTGAAATAAVNTYPIVATLVDPGNKLGNYTVSNPTGTLTVTAKALSIASTDRNKVYGQVLTGADFAGTITGLENGDNISVTRTSTGAAATAAVNTYPIVATLVDPGNKLGNYTVSNPTGTLTVTAKALSIASTDRNKVYGQVLTGADFAGTITGLENGDNISVTRSSTGAAATATVNTYPIVATLVDPGNKLGNYTVSNPNGTLTVTAKALSIASTDRNKVYGQVLTGADFAGTITGLENGDNISVTRTSTGAAATAAVNTYPIVATLVDPGNKLGNYTVSNPNGTLTVTAKALSIASTDRNKVYGQVLTGADFAGTITGLENGDNISVTRTSTGAAATAAVNTYPIVATLVDPGNKLGNYTVSNPTGTLTVTAKGLIVTADDKEKFAGTANPLLTVSYAGFVNNEDFNILTTKPTIVTTATLNSVPGDYPITASAAVGTNYSISYVAGILKVKPGAPTDISLAAVTLYENAAAGANAGTLSSTSPDASATFSYTLVAGTGDTDNALFSITANKINTTAALNYETKSLYSVRVRSTTQYGLSLDKVITINLTDVNEVPTLAAIADQTICYTRNTQNVALTGISAGPETSQTTTLSVSSNNANLFDRLTISGTGSTGTLVYQAKTGAAGTATVTVTVKDNGGTANGGVDTYTRTFVITVNALPVLSINSDKGAEVSKGETVLLNATGAATYVWATDNSVIGTVNAATLQVRPRQTTTYTVTGTNASGCSETQSFTITVLDDLAKINATNILTPNGDGFNDKWIIDNIDFYPNNEVKVFDKAGRPVYTKKGYDNSWEGTYNGTALGEGTYYYVIDFGTGRRLFKGFITIIRNN